MHKFLTGLAVAATVALFGTAALADCFEGHGASAMSQKQETVALTTHDVTTPSTTDSAKQTVAVTVRTCAEGDANCTSASR